MTTTETTNEYTFRLQASIVEEMRKLAEEQGKTLDQFMNEKLAAIRDLAYWEGRAKRADRAAYRDLLNNGGGNESPREGDEIPEGWISRRQAKKM